MNLPTAPYISVPARRLASWIASNAPAHTAVAVGPILPTLQFDPAEECSIPEVIDTRRNEFRTGRHLAREALAQLGCESTSMPADPDRVPRWPEGFVGSISHSGALCVAHVGRSRDLVAIGIDIEAVGRLNSDLSTLICSPEETNDHLLLRFVAKEAFFKAYFPVARTFLDFHDVHIMIDSNGTKFEAIIVNPECPSLHGSRKFAGALVVIEGYATAAVWITY